MKLPRAPAQAQDALLARRSFLTLAAIAVASPTAPALASIANLRDEQFGYTLSYPDDWVPAPKPGRVTRCDCRSRQDQLTHPVRDCGAGESEQRSTHDFCWIDTALARVAQVAARVLDTELTRDGVKDVLLRKVRGTAADEWFLGGALQPCASPVLALC
eukprot:scaffold78541_cov62-Phaeocystis_antarctica.AAC.5